MEAEIGRGGENRTPIKGFGDLYSAVELHPLVHVDIIMKVFV